MAEASPPRGAGPGPRPSRRAFVKAIGTTALAASLPAPWDGCRAASGANDGRVSPSSADESPIARFYRALDDERRRRLCFPYDHPNRSRLECNWAIVKPTIGDLSREQRSLCREVFEDLCSEDGRDRILRQMEDDGGGFGRYHVALFGTPGAGLPCEWVLTGRHATLRAIDDGRGGVACGAPFFYGHSGDLSNPDGNAWSHQGRQAAAIFSTLDEGQRRRALVDAGMPSDPLAAGISAGSLDGPQKQMVRQLLRDLIRPFRAFEVDEVRHCLDEPEGADALRLTFFKVGKPGSDRPEDIWKLEGPTFAWSFHGSPHVHSWVVLSPRSTDSRAT